MYWASFCSKKNRNRCRNIYILYYQQSFEVYLPVSLNLYNLHILHTWVHTDVKDNSFEVSFIMRNWETVFYVGFKCRMWTKVMRLNVDYMWWKHTTHSSLHNFSCPKHLWILSFLCMLWFKIVHFVSVREIWIDVHEMFVHYRVESRTGLPRNFFVIQVNWYRLIIL
jgi:hypothetical protein